MYEYDLHYSSAVKGCLPGSYALPKKSLLPHFMEDLRRSIDSNLLKSSKLTGQGATEPSCRLSLPKLPFKVGNGTPSIELSVAAIGAKD